MAAAYGRHVPLRSAVVFGGVPLDPQIKELRAGVELLVATPGRLLDLVGQRAANLGQVEILVLDEGDRMLDMGFIPDIRRILALMPNRSQTLLFSATFSDEIRRLLEGVPHRPGHRRGRRRATPPPRPVRQVLYPVDRERKLDLLEHLVRSHDLRQVLVFTRTKVAARRIASDLDRHGFAATAIHSDRTQAERIRALADFKAGEVEILVATDVASRGPRHRGAPGRRQLRAADQGRGLRPPHRPDRPRRASGIAISLACPDEVDLLRAIQRLLKRAIPVEVVEELPARPGDAAAPDPHVLREARRAGSRSTATRPSWSTAAAERRGRSAAAPRPPRAPAAGVTSGRPGGPAGPTSARRGRLPWDRSAGPSRRAAGTPREPTFMSDLAPHRHPHRRRRRPRPQLRHQERRLPLDRARLRRPRPAPRLGGAHPHAARAPSPTRTTSGRSTGSTRGRSTGPAGPPSTRAAPTRRKMRAGKLPDVVPADRLAALRDRRGHLRLHAGRPRQPRAPRDRHPDLDRRRRHALLLEGARRRRRPDHRDPQDDGQRRPRDRVLHRLLDRDHPGQGRDQPPADDARLARADRRLPDLRPQRRLHGALHGLRHLGALRDPGEALRPPAPRRRPRRGSPQQPQPVLVRDRLRGRPAGGDGAPGGRRGRRLRPPPQGQHRRVPGRRDQAPDRHRDGQLRADLRPPLRRSRRARPDGRHHVRQRGHGAGRRRQDRPDDGDPRRPLRLLPDPRARGPDGRRRALLQRRPLSAALRPASSACRSC